MMPVGAEPLVKAGHEVFVETQAGVASGFADEDYVEGRRNNCCRRTKEVFVASRT